MTIELIKQLLDACYLAKRAREMLPALPEGVTSSYIQCLDVIQKLQTRGIQPKISDLSDTLNLPRPGVTRTVKEMEHKGYLRKQVSAEDGRVTYLFLTESGQALSQKYNTDYFSQLLPYLDSISEEDAACTIQTLEKFYAIMRERKDSLENDKTDFTQGRILPKLAFFMLPILGALVLQAAYGAVDLLVVGRFGSTSGLSAVSTGSQVLNLVTFVVTQLAMGVTVLIARYLGEKRPQYIGQVIGGAAIVFTLLAAALFVVLVFLHGLLPV